MRASINISLPLALKQWVDQQIRQGGFGTASEYMRQLIREEQRRQTRVAVEAKLLDAEESGEPVPVTAETWKETEKRVAKRLKAVARQPRAHGKNR
jgi:antitoxin ParD1/3/4